MKDATVFARTTEIFCIDTPELLKIVEKESIDLVTKDAAERGFYIVKITQHVIDEVATDYETGEKYPIRLLNTYGYCKPIIDEFERLLEQ